MNNKALAFLYRETGGPLLAAIAYYIGAIVAFSVGTLSDQIYAPFWPPNVILFGALISTKERRWPVYLIAVIPAHILAEMWVAMPPHQMIMAYLTNATVAVLAAWMFQRRGPTWLADLPEGLIRILVVATIAPALAGFGGALVRILGGAGPEGYWGFWLEWYVGNMLAFLTLGPAIVTWLGRRRFEPLSSARMVEATLVSLCVIAATIASTRLGARLEDTGFLPAILYLPLPFILWASVRFGAAGASAAVLLVAIVSITSTLDGPSVFSGSSIDSTVLALQFFLIGIAITALPLGATVDEWHFAQLKSRWLARSLLDARDEERRRIARELHDSTGQNLVAASMIVDHIASEDPRVSSIETLRSSLHQSIREIRTLSYLLHPPFLDEGGLKMALQNFVEGYTERTGIAVEMDVSIEPGVLPNSTELTLFRVVQEGLLNVSRHSGSPSASVALGQTRSGQVGRLVIEDSGRGLANQSGRLQGIVHIPTGVGLSSMRERMLQIGGQLDIQSSAKGTVIYASFPIERRDMK